MGASPNYVLFICVENACRSLIAEAAFNADPPSGWQARSAGTRPASSPNARTGAMLTEIGLALPDHPPQALTPEWIENSRIRVTMGCLDDASCPARLKSLELRDWGLSDPAREDDPGFRRIRDDVVARTRALVQEIRTADRTPVPVGRNAST